MGHSLFSPSGNSAVEDRSKVAAIMRSQAVIEFDLTGKVLTANDVFLRTVGYDLTEIVGKHHRLFVDPAEASRPRLCRLLGLPGGGSLP